MSYASHIDATTELEHVPLEPVPIASPRDRAEFRMRGFCRVGDLLPLSS
jgi:hypothetical protein